MHSYFRLPLLTLAALMLSAQALAASSDREKPIEIFSHHMKSDEVAQVSTYDGAVRLYQGTLEVLGETLTIVAASDGYKTITVKGSPVKLKQKRDNTSADEWIHATGLTAIYDERSDTIRFIEKAKIARSENGLIKDSSSGDLIAYNMLSGHIQIEINKNQSNRSRVSTILSPRQSTPSDSKAPAVTIKPNKIDLPSQP